MRSGWFIRRIGRSSCRSTQRPFPTSGVEASIRVPVLSGMGERSCKPSAVVPSRMKTAPSGNEAITVPAEAVVTTTNGAFVYVVEDGKAKRVMVKVGRPAGTRVKLDSGLVGGEQVVVEGQNRLQDGAKVELRSALSKDRPSGARKPGNGASQPRGATR